MLYVVSLIGQLILQCRTQTGMHFHSLAKGIIYWTGAFVFNFVALVFYIGKHLKKVPFPMACPPIQPVPPFNWSANTGQFVDEASLGPMDTILSHIIIAIYQQWIVYIEWVSWSPSFNPTSPTKQRHFYAKSSISKTVWGSRQGEGVRYLLDCCHF